MSREYFSILDNYHVNVSLKVSFTWYSRPVAYQFNLVLWFGLDWKYSSFKVVMLGEIRIFEVVL